MWLLFQLVTLFALSPPSLLKEGDALESPWFAEQLFSGNKTKNARCVSVLLQGR